MSKQVIKLPGLIDVHVHMREPGDEHKEDWSSGTAAALAGGVIAVLAMPNTKPALKDKASLQIVNQCANKGARCDFALYSGATEDNHSNTELTKALASGTVALKMYLNTTFGELKLDHLDHWRQHIKSWPTNRPICVHAEGVTLSAVLFLACAMKRALHVCHVSSKSEMELILAARALGTPVTCEVCPHHLIYSYEALKKKYTHTCGRCEVKPPLQTDSDVEALWNYLPHIDIFATDHAPHTPVEKDRKESFVPGFPGVQYLLPLLLTFHHKGKLTIEDITRRTHDNPIKIFSLQTHFEHLTVENGTYVEVDLLANWIVPSDGGYSKAQWTPYEGMNIVGKVIQTVVRGNVVYDHEMGVLAKEGSGKQISLTQIP